MKARFGRCAMAAVAVPLLFACGGDNEAPPEVLTPAVVVGPITGFGSVVVNGRRFDDSAATVTMDDAVQARDRLRIGMMVQIRARIRADGSAIADAIQYNDCMEGPITAMNRVQNTVEVMGQTVQVDDGTVFDGVTLRDMNSFAIGDQVEISCQPDPAHNRVRATRMERKGTYANGVDTVEVKGRVSNLNAANGTCTIGSLTVNFAGVPAGERPAGLANGMTVEASGKGYVGNVLTADRLRDRDRDRISWPDGSAVEVEGYVTDFVSISNFKVDGRVVNAASAVIRNGTAADVANGVRVEAEGPIVSGVLVATRLILKLETNVQVQAGLQAKDATANTVTLLGQSIALTADTVVVDRTGTSALQPRVIALSALNTGDRLEVMAWRSSTGALTAAWIERTDADALVVVKGPADAKTPTTQLTLAGFNVATGASSRYRDADGTLIDAATFYGLVAVPPAVPTMVRARGIVASLATNTLDATRTASTIGELEITR
jgi:hypothetical protein